MDDYRRTIEQNPFIPISLNPRQSLFVTYPAKEIMYGGAAGGGKSFALLAAALQYVHVPGYRALLLRRAFADLMLPEALIPISHEWLRGKAKWYAKRNEWRFPSGATLTFGYLATDADKDRYAGAAFQFIGFDELTQFEQGQYRFLFSRLRRSIAVPVPLRMRSATNPGGIGHDWVRKRFIQSESPERVFIPAKIEDNPKLDAQSYEQSLAELDPLTRARLRHGDWNIRPEGTLFKREWFDKRMFRRAPEGRRVRYWDLAASRKQETSDPDYAVGVLLIENGDSFYVDDVRRLRSTPQEVEKLLFSTARLDGYGVPIRIEREPGSSGILYVNSVAQRLAAFDVRGIPAVIDKETRAKPASAACERGDVFVRDAGWSDEFLDELCGFPEVSHDDQVDAFTGAYNYLARGDQEWSEEAIEKLLSRPEDQELTRRYNPFANINRN